MARDMDDSVHVMTISCVKLGVYLNSRVHHSIRRVEGANFNSLLLKLLPVIAGRSTVPRSGLPALSREV